MEDEMRAILYTLRLLAAAAAGTLVVGTISVALEEMWPGSIVLYGDPNLWLWGLAIGGPAGAMIWAATDKDGG